MMKFFTLNPAQWFIVPYEIFAIISQRKDCLLKQGLTIVDKLRFYRLYVVLRRKLSSVLIEGMFVFYYPWITRVSKMVGIGHH